MSGWMLTIEEIRDIYAIWESLGATWNERVQEVVKAANRKLVAWQLENNLFDHRCSLHIMQRYGGFADCKICPLLKELGLFDDYVQSQLQALRRVQRLE